MPNRESVPDSGNSFTFSVSPNDAFPPPAPAPQIRQGPLSLNDAYEYLKQLRANPPQAQASNVAAPDAGASSPPLAPEDESNFSGGLLGRLAAVLGVDPQNPDQPALRQDDPSTGADDDPVWRWARQHWV